jgi:hypothetical protein
MEVGRAVGLMDSLGILNWKALSIGWGRGWATRADVINYAVDRLQSDADDDISAVASLASAEDLDDESIRELLARLAGEQAEEDGIALEKWRLARLLDLDGMDLGWDEKVTRLEELGAEFGYPPDMRLCTRYGPSQASIDAGFASPDDLSTGPLDAMRQVITSLKRRLGVA